MPHIFTTEKAGGTFGNTGQFIYAKPAISGLAAADYIQAALPSGIIAMARKPSAAVFNGAGFSRQYFVGGWTDNLVMTENFAVLRQGIIAPSNDLVNAAGSGRKVGVVVGSGTGVTGTIIPYISWRDDLHGRRSPLSEAGPSFAATDDDFDWSNLPAAPDDGDPSVTHLELWRSVDGSLPAKVMQLQKGVTSVTENVATLALGEIFTTTFQRFPRCDLNLIYHDRQVMAGDARHPDRVYLSVLNQPEDYNGFFLRTRGGEPVTALARVRDVLLVFGPNSSYIVQGYTEDDIQMEFLEPEIGCISHHGIVNVHGLAIVPTHLGFYLTTGTSMHYLSEYHQRFFRQEYKSHKGSYEGGWGVNDPETNVYLFYVSNGNSLTEDLPTQAGATDSTKRYTKWVIDYTKLLAEHGGQFEPPDVGFDVRDRQDLAGAVLRQPGRSVGTLVSGSCDGHIREENVATDGDDDADTFDKTWLIRTSHVYPGGEPGGPDTEGTYYHGLWNHMISENDDYKLNLYVGDSDAWRAATADCSITVPAGAAFTGDNSDALVAREPYYFEPRVAGRGITLEVVASGVAQEVSVPNVIGSADYTIPQWLGWGGLWRPGKNRRSVLALGNVE